MADNIIKAIALLTADDVNRLGTLLDQVYVIEPTDIFDDLISVLDRPDHSMDGSHGNAKAPK